MVVCRGTLASLMMRVDHNNTSRLLSIATYAAYDRVAVACKEVIGSLLFFFFVCFLYRISNLCVSVCCPLEDNCSDKESESYISLYEMDQ